MDKNTITGLVLIAILLVGFSFLSRPSQEQLEAQQRYYDSIAQVQQREADLKAKAEAALANESGAEASVDSTALFFDARQGTNSQVTIQNNLAEITVDTKGGRIASATLKEYMGQDKTTPVTLFSGNDASMNFLFYNKKETIQTEDYYFTAVNRTDSTVTMRLSADSNSYIDFTYSMHNDTYLIDFTIQAVNMEGKLAATNNYVDIEWSQRARQIEKGYTYENRLAELTYKIAGEGTDYLSANKNDEKEVPERLDWIAFKNQFFSSVFLADADFEKTKRVLKPKIDEINKKYPKQEDAMKKQQEVMGLYSQYGVSPMGGCLPMLIQFPILMALFMFVPSAIELRQQSFLWADDLSTYDAFINFPFHIPFLGSHLSLFCLLMTVTNILNTKYMMQQQDTGANPQMAAMKWMSYLMPIMFLFILNDYPSGLNYYYFISTLVSVVTTLIMRKTTNEEALLAQLEANKKDPKKMKKTGFAARLEAMQKQQEQMMKEKQNKK